MKKLIFTLCLLAGISFAGNAQKFAMVDMEYIMKNIPAFETANEQLNQISKNGNRKWMLKCRKFRICIKITRLNSYLCRKK